MCIENAKEAVNKRFGEILDKSHLRLDLISQKRKSTREKIVKVKIEPVELITVLPESCLEEKNQPASNLTENMQKR